MFAAGVFQESRDRLVRVARAKPTAFLRVATGGSAWIIKQLMPDESRSPQSTSGIAGCRLDPDILEGPFAKETTIGNAIESDTTGKHQIFLRGLAVQFSGHPQHDLFGYFLDAGSQIHVALLEHRFASFAAGVRGSWTRPTAKQYVQPAIGHGTPLAIVE